MKTFVNWFLIPILMTCFVCGLVWYYNTIKEALWSILFAFPWFMICQTYINSVVGKILD